MLIITLSCWEITALNGNSFPNGGDSHTSTDFRYFQLPMSNGVKSYITNLVIKYVRLVKVPLFVIVEMKIEKLFVRSIPLFTTFLSLENFIFIMCHLGIVLVHYIRQNDAERCCRKACQQKSKRKPTTWSEFQKPYKTFFFYFLVSSCKKIKKGS